MEIIQDGVHYAVKNVKSDEVQHIVFVHKGEDDEIVPGTTNEELVRVLLSRYIYLNKRKYLPENQTIIILLRNIEDCQRRRKTMKMRRINESKNTEHSNG